MNRNITSTAASKTLSFVETIGILNVTVQLGMPRVEDVTKSAIMLKYVVPGLTLLFIFLILW